MALEWDLRIVSNAGSDSDAGWRHLAGTGGGAGAFYGVARWEGSDWVMLQGIKKWSMDE